MAVERTILHVDMDAFFAAIEQLDRPELRGKPILIGYDGPRGVVATASYEARPFGCHSAQPMAIARRLCPQAIVVPVRGSRYREVSKQMFAILDAFSPLVEPVSVDEAFIDATGCERLFGSGESMAAQLKARIREELKLTASVGVAPNKFLAKLASDMNKPDGLTVVKTEEVETFLEKLPIGRMWGVGKVTEEKLRAAGVKTIGDLKRMPPEWMKGRFGSDAERYMRLCRGVDERAVTPDGAAKSIGHEQTFGQDLEKASDVRRVLLEQVEQVARRVRRAGLMTRSVSLKIRFGDFQTISRSMALDSPTDATDVLWQAASTLFDRWAKSSYQPVRLIGMQAQQLIAGEAQMGLFTDAAAEKRKRMDSVTDQITGKFGKGAIRRGGTME
ncbi:MAG: DNA polymerase IV [Planctomycetes bacterium]|nr:DNA polymerase IV [Planctomycetota bacterium]